MAGIMNYKSSVEDSVSLSQSTISSLSNSLSTTLASALQTILPAIIAQVSKAGAYLGGANRFTGPAFSTALMGPTAFSAAQAMGAINMGYLNKDAYMMNYARAMGYKGFTSAGASSFMSNIPGGMDRLTGGLQQAYGVAASATSISPMFSMMDTGVRMKSKAYVQQFRQFREAARARGIEVSDTETEQQIAAKLAAQDPNWAKDPNSKVAQTYNKLTGIRTGSIDPREAFFDSKGIADWEAKIAGVEADRRKTEASEDFKKKSKEEQDAKRREWADTISSYRKQRNDLIAKGQTAFDEGNVGIYNNMSASERIFRYAAAGDIALSGAMSFTQDDIARLQEGWGKNGDLVGKEEGAKQAADIIRTQAFIRESGGSDNASLVLGEMAKKIGSMSLDDLVKDKNLRSAFQAAGYGGTTDKDWSDFADQFKKDMASTDSERQGAAMQKMMGVLSLDSTKNNDFFGGLVAQKELYGLATGIAGGDSKAGQDAVHTAMAWMGLKGEADLAGDKNADNVEALRKVLGSTAIIPEGVGALDRVAQRVAVALGSLGKSATDAAGRTTKFAANMNLATLNNKVHMQYGGISQENADIISTELTRDIAGGSANQYAGAALGLLMKAGVLKDEGQIQAAVEAMAGKTPEEVDAWIAAQKGMGDEAVAALHGMSDDQIAHVSETWGGTGYLAKYGSEAIARAADAENAERFADEYSAANDFIRKKQLENGATAEQAAVAAELAGAQALGDMNTAVSDWTTPEEYAQLRDKKYQTLSTDYNVPLPSTTAPKPIDENDPITQALALSGNDQLHFSTAGQFVEGAERSASVEMADIGESAKSAAAGLERLSNASGPLAEFFEGMSALIQQFKTATEGAVN